MACPRHFQPGAFAVDLSYRTWWHFGDGVWSPPVVAQQNEAVRGQSDITDPRKNWNSVAQQRSLENYAFVGIERQRSVQFLR